jgi:hypothetical protein
MMVPSSTTPVTSSNFAPAADCAPTNPTIITAPSVVHRPFMITWSFSKNPTVFETIPSLANLSGWTIEWQISPPASPGPPTGGSPGVAAPDPARRCADCTPPR